MFYHLQSTIPLVSICEHPEEKTFISPMPAQVVLGHLTLHNDCEEFLQALDAGMECYYGGDYKQVTMQASALLQDLQSNLEDEEDEEDDKSSLAWRLGFIMGKVFGLLNPDLALTSPRLPYLDVLSRKGQALYPAPSRLSAHIQVVHQQAGIQAVEG
jgi:hypothetical protein